MYMRILFCADTFPGRFGPLAAAFAADGHEVLFASHYGRRDFALPGVKRVLLKPVRMRRSDDPASGEAARMEWNKALVTAHHAAEAFATLRNRGFVPDMAVFAASSGAALALTRAFPEAVLLGFADALHARASREEAEAAQLRMRACLAQSHACFAFSEQHLDSMPPLLRRAACLLPPAVDTDFFSPEAAQPFVLEGQSMEEAELVTVDLRSVPAASSRSLWNLCAGLLAHRPECRILMTCAEAHVREAAQAMAQALPHVWQERLLVQEFKSLHEWRDMLCASAVHIVPEALSASSPLPEVLEAMSCGTLLAVPEEAARGIERFFLGLKRHACGCAEAEAPCASGGEVPLPAKNVKKFLPPHAEKTAFTGEEKALFSPVSAESERCSTVDTNISYGNNSLFLLPLSKQGTARQLEAVCRMLAHRKDARLLKNQARCIILETCPQRRMAPVQYARLLESFHFCKTENTVR